MWSALAGYIMLFLIVGMFLSACNPAPETGDKIRVTGSLPFEGNLLIGQ